VILETRTLAQIVLMCALCAVQSLVNEDGQVAREIVSVSWVYLDAKRPK